ncbi:MAG: P-II family nitrogen regulator [Clostridiales bacterium]|nr:P-II family nitrogen regulator [Clostridiales bacterium]
MLALKHMMVITKREFSEQYLEFFHRHQVNGVISTLCNGTATDSTLDALSLEKTEKLMFETMVREQDMDGVISGLIKEMKIDGAGNGIALFLPVDGVGSSSLKYFIGEREVQKKEEQVMVESKSILIITIVDKGNTELVMDAARAAGAGGGTVMRAKGTGAEIAKFFGVSISEEKEMVYIVASRKGRDDIMRAIMEKAGRNTEAHGVVFSLPVDKVIGIREFEQI